MNIKKIVPVLAVLLFAFILSGCPDGKLDPSPQPLDFRDVYVGTTKTATASWTNNGNVQAAISGMAVSSPPTFTGPAGQISENVDSGQSSSQFTFTFAPTSAGTANGEAQIFASGVRPKKLRLTGVGIFQKNGTTISITELPQSEALDFKETPVGTNKTKTFKLKNNNPAKAETVSSVWKNGGNVFAVNPAGNITIPANGEVTITVTFTPDAVADYSNILEFTNIDNIAGTVVKGKGTQG